MCLWDSNRKKALISGIPAVPADKRAFGTALEIEKKPSKSMGERGRCARF
jgi:hypothetical protein